MSDATYSYFDEHVRDMHRTHTELTAEPQNGWRREYHEDDDTWHAWTPSGLHRVYRRDTPLDEVARISHENGLYDDDFDEPEQPTRTWACGDCGETVERYRGMSDVSCTCAAEYNSSGQRLRDDWRGNPAWRHGVIDDMTGYEIQQLAHEIGDR